MKDILGKYTFRTAIFCFRLSSYLTCIPFQLSTPHSFHVELFQTIWRIGLWYFINGIVLTNSAYQILSFFWSISVHGLTTQSSIHLIYLCMAPLSILYFMTMLLMPDRAVAFINQINFVIKLSESKSSRCRNL